MSVLGVGVEELASVVSAGVGRGAEITAVEQIEPWSVLRVAFVLPARRGTGSVVVKVRREHGGRSGHRSHPSRVLTEYAALMFLAEAAPGYAPRVLSAELERGLLVLEDLAPLVPLFDLLVGDADGSAEALRLFARRLAELHGRTVGTEERYYGQRGGLGAVDREDDRQLVLGSAWDWTLPDLRAAGSPGSNEAELALHAAKQLLVEPNPFHSFSSGDCGANNFLTDGRRGYFTDWESAGFRHVLLDAACLYVPNSIWMTLADPRASGADDVYRETLATAIPEANTHEYQEALAAACLVRAVDRLKRFPILDERQPGDESRAQMVSTLDCAVRAAQHLHAFSALAAWVDHAGTVLRQRWPDADLSFPDAYTTRSR